MQIDLRVLELLASKLCHDLVSPVSAINNGVELIEDIGGPVVDEAMKLIGDSAGHASRRLRLFRMAYGRAGSEANLAVRDVQAVAEQYLSGGKSTLHWPEGVLDEEFAFQRGSLKTLINMLILAEEVLAYGGDITLHPLNEEGRKGCRVEVAGRNAQLVPGFQEALAGTVDVEELTPRSIQAYVTGTFANHFGLRVSHEQPDTDRLMLTLEVEGQSRQPAALSQ